MQICNITCDECENYPDETCAYVPDDEKKGKNQGMCASTFVVYEGILVERGCDSFPGITPVPAVEGPPSEVDWTLPSSGNSSTVPYSSSGGNNVVDSTATVPPQSSSNSSSSGKGGNRNNNTNSQTAPYSSGTTTSEPPAHSHSPSPSVAPHDNSMEMGSAPRDGDGGDGCIDAKALTHIPQSQLVYGAHVRRGVLCDAFGSCATPGHMVVLHGKAMSMRRYCVSVGGCARRVMEVNSPRYSGSLRLPSRTMGVQYTAFAARYESGFEEKVLRLAIHIGL